MKANERGTARWLALTAKAKQVLGTTYAHTQRRPRLGPLIGHERGGSHGTRTSMTFTPAATAARVTDGLMASATPPGTSLVLASRHGPTDNERWRRSERRAAHATRRTRPPRDTHVRQRLRPRPGRVDSGGASDGEATEDSDKNNGRDKAPGNRCDAATAAERAAQSHDETRPLRRRAPAAMGKRGQRVAPRTAHETQKQATSYELRIDRINDEARKTGDGSAGPATGETAENESVARGPRRCRRHSGGQETGDRRRSGWKGAAARAARRTQRGP